jgi:hypothetical protein
MGERGIVDYDVVIYVLSDLVHVGTWTSDKQNLASD